MPERKDFKIEIMYDKVMNGLNYFWCILRWLPESKNGDGDWFNWGHGREETLDKAFMKAKLYYESLMEDSGIE